MRWHRALQGPDDTARVIFEGDQSWARLWEPGELFLGFADCIRVGTGVDVLGVEGDAAHAPTVDHTSEVEHGHLEGAAHPVTDGVGAGLCNMAPTSPAVAVSTSYATAVVEKGADIPAVGLLTTQFRP